MKKPGIALLCSLSLLLCTCNLPHPVSDDFRKLADAEKKRLRLSTFITAQTVEQMFTSDAGRREMVSLLHCYGITKVCFEVYRGGLVIPPELIAQSVEFLKKEGFEVSGGIATVPGDSFGVRQEGPLEWFNWQNRKTQDDLRKVMEESAPFFDSFIVDDFLCTSDTSLESKIARGDRSWSVYRRALMTGLTEKVIIGPAKERNPNLKVIIKYPQWYDRFHLFGYDVAAESQQFDGIWVGTESRGQYTQRFGFVQPYEGFINFRWLSTVAGKKTGGAWFDHEDCTDIDFLDQAYQSVLAGAKEIIIFSFDSFISGHPGHHLLMQDFEKLAKLAGEVGSHPVTGAVGYKPPNSDAGGDLYILDYIGMLGISLVPESVYPESANVIFLPSQAASDSGIIPKIEKSLRDGARIIMTAGFLDRVKEGAGLASMAQIRWPMEKTQEEYSSVISDGEIVKLKLPLKTDYSITSVNADVLLETGGKSSKPFLTVNKKRNIYVINTHTFSQADFEAAGELLLSPRMVGLLELPGNWVNTIRDVFTDQNLPVIEAPSRVTIQVLSGKGLVIQNYNNEACQIRIRYSSEQNLTDGFSEKNTKYSGKVINLNIGPRSRIWLKDL